MCAERKEQTKRYEQIAITDRSRTRLSVHDPSGWARARAAEQQQQRAAARLTARTAKASQATLRS